MQLTHVIQGFNLTFQIIYIRLGIYWHGTAILVNIWNDSCRKRYFIYDFFSKWYVDKIWVLLQYLWIFIHGHIWVILELKYFYWVFCTASNITCSFQPSKLCLKICKKCVKETKKYVCVNRYIASALIKIAAKIFHFHGIRLKARKHVCTD